MKKGKIKRATIFNSVSEIKFEIKFKKKMKQKEKQQQQEQHAIEYNGSNILKIKLE